MNPFSTILIANRGEIARRVIRTARRMGLRTVAVHSEADAGAPHVREADEAVLLGPAPAAESYLRIDAILDAARQTRADAIHPGYGFLSENAAFARALDDAGIVFIGPNLEAIEVMGSKSASKDLMERAGVPVSPGYQGEDQSLATFKREAERIGYPVLLKASAGGGGKGMRLVEKPSELKAALEGAQREGKASFGDDRILIEKFIVQPRHVEVQVFGDAHGGLVHLYERDCTVQRRHQKVIEEAPAPNLPEDVRARLHQAALDAARAVNYRGAGTVEFLYSAATGDVFFMEMNTRLQVEHPVTEMVTGLDLVEWQIRVARGEKLPLAQDQIRCEGCAFEARLYAEDPAAGFLPSTGTLERLSLPEPVAGVRLDMGVEEGGAVSPHYDPMIGKLIAHGADRSEALGKLARMLAETRAAGLQTNAAFLHRLARHPAFAAAKPGAFDTGFIAAHETDLLSPAPPPAAAYAALLVWTSAQQRSAGADPWDALMGFRVNRRSFWKLTLDDGEGQVSAEMTREGAGWRLASPGGEGMIEAAEADGGTVRFALDDRSIASFCARSGAAIRVWLGAEHWDFTPYAPRFESEHASAKALLAPMPGVVRALPVKPGAKVKTGATLLVMEAMKMEHAIAAPSDGVLKAHRFKVGDQVAQGELLVDFEAVEAD